ncbi:MinD/ParA family protein [Desertibacillus haloalkaliphilus]|uniref:MinD/ParA family protein n=1 Tax=Desertibacillus haloalkaliphilus TaxID=1328930 RepID=UPI001C27CB6E|nr:MinD/ParA family protein [Desertibacillus haloalkaliphilus]MBU8906993.1 MinD/ParA family protein [Desertibacillus haloalkaliphilus]
MNDQAKSLRQLVDNMKKVDNTQVVSVISGKGGVGKSNFSLNFAIGLAQLGKKVVLFDLDIGMANIDILMGLTPSYHIVDMIERELSIWDIIEKGPENISYIAGGSGFSTIFSMSEQKQTRFMTQLEALNQAFDYIIFDMGAGVSEDSLQFILASNEAILVTTPEPTSITDAYAMIKYIHMRNQELTCSLLVNRSESDKEGKATADNLRRVARQFLQKDLHTVGVIPNDKAVLKAVKSQTPFLLQDPGSKPSRAIKEITKAYIGQVTDEKKLPFSSFVTKFRRYFTER